jgi:hypothetical protein
MTLASGSLVIDVKPSSEVCACVGPCTGYDSCSNCPPLIVLAVLADSDSTIPIAHNPSGQPK